MSGRRGLILIILFVMVSSLVVAQTQTKYHYLRIKIDTDPRTNENGNEMWEFRPGLTTPYYAQGNDDSTKCDLDMTEEDGGNDDECDGAYVLHYEIVQSEDGDSFANHMSSPNICPKSENDGVPRDIVEWTFRDLGDSYSGDYHCVGGAGNDCSLSDCDSSSDCKTFRPVVDLLCWGNDMWYPCDANNDQLSLNIGEMTANCSDGDWFFVETFCNDDKDNNRDGLIDCQDPQCLGKVDSNGITCAAESGANCNDGIDNDGDNLIDGFDGASQGGTCLEGSLPPSPGTECEDNVDNDQDGLTDWADDGCYDNVCGGIDNYESAVDNATLTFGNALDGCCGNNDPFGTIQVCTGGTITAACTGFPPNLCPQGCIYTPPSDCDTPLAACEAACGVSNWPCLNQCYMDYFACQSIPGTCTGTKPHTCETVTSSTTCTGIGCTWNGAQGLGPNWQDYGYFDSTGVYFCSKDDLKGDYTFDFNDWKWRQAGSSAFEIHTLNQGKYDVISNGEEWFACNANINTLYTGDLSSANEVVEYGTFQEAIQDIRTCTEALAAYGYRGCDIPGGINTLCCSPQSTFTLNNFESSCNTQCRDASGSTFSNQNSVCDLDTQNVIRYCQARPSQQDSDYPLRDQCGICIEDDVVFDPTKSCDTIQQTYPQYNSLVCDDARPVCDNGEFVTSTENGVTNRTCCVGREATCQSISSGETCASLGGSVVTQNSRCFGHEENIGGEQCCLGLLDVDLSQIFLTDPEAFICLNKNGNNMFVECCSSGSCENGVPDTDLKGILNRRFVGAGAPAFQLDVFDPFEVDVINRISRHTFTPSTPGDEAPIPNFDIRFTDWSGFDLLEFDVGYNSPGVPDRLILKSSSGIRFDLGPLFNYFTNPDRAALKGHHVVVPLDPVINGRTIDYADINGIIVNITPGFSEAKISFDNFFLRSTNGASSATRYCAGDAGVWIDDMDPPSGTVFSDFTDYGKYKIVCDEQVSFHWTGHYCCGDDTRSNYGEFFNDSVAGCYNGSTIFHDETLAEAYQDYSDPNPRLLFFNGEFVVCGDAALSEFQTIGASYDGQTVNASFIESKATFLESRGSWYCDVDGWAPTDQAPKLKILGAALKSMGESAGDYSLHCGDINNVMNYNSTLNVPGIVGSREFCVLQTGDEVTVGAVVNSSAINNFLNNDLKFFHPIVNDATVFNCDFSAIEVFNSTHFFRECAETGSWLNASYNEPIGLLVFSMKTPPGGGGIIGFFYSVWTGIVDFFRNLFRSEASFGFISIVDDLKTYEEADYSELYIKKVDSKQVYGLRHEDTMIVFYQNFTSSLGVLGNLTNQSFNNLGQQYNFMFSGTPGVGNDQAISVNGSVVNEFNWNYLTSNLKFN